MKRNSIFKIVNPILAILFLNQILTGLLNEVIPEKTYGVIHGGGGFLIAIAVLVHVIFNWNWVKANFFKKNPKK